MLYDIIIHYIFIYIYIYSVMQTSGHVGSLCRMAGSVVRNIIWIEAPPTKWSNGACAIYTFADAVQTIYCTYIKSTLKT